MAGRKQEFLPLCLSDGFVGVDFDVDTDLSGSFTDEWHDFNKVIIPLIKKFQPEKTKIGAGLAGGCIWRIGKGIRTGDIVLCPNGEKELHIGEVSGDYFYVPGQPLQHRRKVTWFEERIPRNDLSTDFKNALGAGLSVICIDDHGSEIENFLGGNSKPVTLTTNDESIEDPAVFALEKYLEEFLISNWDKTQLSKKYDIYSEDGQTVGQQYETDTGRIDILAISKDHKELLVIELKKGRASDKVVGQIQTYMGYLIEEFVEEGQTVKGLIIALEDDPKIRRALVVAKGIDFYRYEVDFRLIPISS